MCLRKPLPNALGKLEGRKDKDDRAEHTVGQ
jgi:hypothetical protein